MKENLKTYFIDFDETDFESGVDMIAIVSNPAIQKLAMRFSNVELPKKATFSVNEDKKIIAGAALIPNKPILRYDEVKDEFFYVVFTEEVIERMVEKFNKELRSKKFNYEHDNNFTISGFIKGSWIIEDPEKDKSVTYGFTDLPKGTWFIEAKIEDNTVWENVIKNMDTVGFSVEGFMEKVNVQFTEVIKELNNNNKNKNMKKRKFNAVVTKSTKRFDKVTGKFIFEETTEQDVIVVEGEIKEGSTVEVLDPETMELAPAEDGEYTVEGQSIMVEDGEIVAVVEVEETEMEETEEDEKEEMETVEEAVEEAVEDATEESVEDQINQLLAKIAELEAKIAEMETTDEDEEFEDEPKKDKYSSITSLLGKL